jgi:hypothetical protein
MGRPDIADFIDNGQVYLFIPGFDSINAISLVLKEKLSA